MARRLLEERPELVDLRIEDDGPRAGMLSVARHGMATASFNQFLAQEFAIEQAIGSPLLR